MLQRPSRPPYCLCFASEGEDWNPRLSSSTRVYLQCRVKQLLQPFQCPQESTQLLDQGNNRQSVTGCVRIRGGYAYLVIFVIKYCVQPDLSKKTVTNLICFNLSRIRVFNGCIILMVDKLNKKPECLYSEGIWGLQGTSSHCFSNLDILCFIYGQKMDGWMDFFIYHRGMQKGHVCSIFSNTATPGESNLITFSFEAFLNSSLVQPQSILQQEEIDSPKNSSYFIISARLNHRHGANISLPRPEDSRLFPSHLICLVGLNGNKSGF